MAIGDDELFEWSLVFGSNVTDVTTSIMRKRNETHGVIDSDRQTDQTD